MVFSSTVFLCGFLPIVLIVYFICPARFRNLFLLLASLFFYGWGEPKYILIMLFSTVFDYCNGRLMEYMDQIGRPQYRKWVLVASLAGNLGILCFFKYTEFIFQSINTLTGSHLPLMELALPIGISFYTFQTLSYTIDVYRREVEVQHSLLSFSVYVCLFPQLIAGPIVRYVDIKDQLADRSIRWDEAAAGMQRFLLGLAKKVLLANQAGGLWNEIAALTRADLTTSAAWLGAIAYTFQIYFDFSGYSDMAIGLGQIFGFRFPENFRYPYESDSITDFWRRWHITMGTWFREYLYIPLGGNRKGAIRQIFNLLVVWFLTGLWHGAGWNFILWGLYFLVLLLIEKFYLLQEMKRWPGFFRHLYALFFIVVGWAIFACTDMKQMLYYIQTMFGAGSGWSNEIAVYYWGTSLLLLLIMAAAGTAMPKKLAGKWCDQVVERWQGRGWIVVQVVRYGWLAVLLFLSIAFLVSGSYNPFLYFRF